MKRYGPSHAMIEFPDGEYVKYEDAESFHNERFNKLEARLAELEKEMLELKELNPIRLRSLGWGHPNEIQHLKARIAKLEKQNDCSKEIGDYVATINCPCCKTIIKYYNGDVG